MELLKNSAFQQWFHQSKVVDEKKNPLVVYHGTIDDFFVFNTEPDNRAFSGLGETAIGGHFSEDREIASYYPFSNRYNKPRKVMEVYLSIQHPKKYRTLKGLKDEVYEFYQKNSLSMLPWEFLHNIQLFKQSLINQGYDGITYLEGPPYNIRKNKRRVWVAFYPWQIKSVDNVGTFNPNNIDIRY